MSQKQQSRQKRHRRITAKVKGTASCPRFSVFRSNKYIYGQLIDDQKGNTLVSASDQDLKGKKIVLKEKMTRQVAAAYRIGQLLAKKAINQGIEKVVFDRGGYKYHGRVKALADGARAKGLKF